MSAEMPPISLYLLDTRTLWPGPDFPTSAAQHLALLPASLTPPIHRYRQPADKRMALGSALLKCHAIHALTHLPFSCITLPCDPRTKKPLHVLPPGNSISGRVHFNASHQAGVVVLAAALARDGVTSIGIDIVNTVERDDLSIIERKCKGRFEDWLDVYKDVFSASQLQDIITRHRGDLQMQLRHFYTMWALKEAYLKYTGEALLAEWVKEVGFVGVSVPREAAEGVWGEQTILIGVDRAGIPLRDVRMELRNRGREWIVALAVGLEDASAEGDLNREGFEEVQLDDIGKCRS